MIRHGRILAALLAGAAAVPAHGQAAAPAPPPTDGAGASALRESGTLCLFDPAAGSRRLREAAILTEPATGDTFVALRPAGRPLPLGFLFPPRRNYVTSRPWYGGDAPLTFRGRTWRRHGSPVTLPLAEMRPVGTTADVWLFERKPAGEPGLVYAPSGTGCAFQPYRAASPPVRGARASRGVPPRHRLVGYLTDRASTDHPRPARRYNDVRGRLATGVADVAISARHRVGRLESRVLIGGGTDTLSHVVLLRLQDSASYARSARALLYIHGFRTTFEDAARITAQLADDVDFDGDVYFFSWPSRGRLVSYMPDETMIQRARGDFAAVMVRLLDAYGAGKVSVLTHSMGSRGFAQAVRDVQPSHPGKQFDHVVLASPDQDFEVFSEQDAGEIVAAANRVTIYASANDRALRASGDLHRGIRAGMSPAELGLLAGIDVVDTSGGSRGVVQHSDYAESPVVLGDLYLLLRGRTPAQRALVQVQSRGGSYWSFRK